MHNTVPLSSTSINSNEFNGKNITFKIRIIPFSVYVPIYFAFWFSYSVFACVNIFHFTLVAEEKKEKRRLIGIRKYYTRKCESLGIDEEEGAMEYNEVG